MKPVASIGACENCGSRRRKVSTYRITHEGLLVEVVLCGPCAQPLRDLMTMGTVVPTHTGEVKVWTMEEIAARKAVQER